MAAEPATGCPGVTLSPTAGGFGAMTTTADPDAMVAPEDASVTVTVTVYEPAFW